jgi:hypothetical protein
MELWWLQVTVFDWIAVGSCANILLLYDRSDAQYRSLAGNLLESRTNDDMPSTCSPRLYSLSSSLDITPRSLALNAC